jgi:hypothetical protein
MGMWWHHSPREPGPYDDDWEDQPTQGPMYQYGLGVMVAVLLAIYGTDGVVHQHIEIGRRVSPVTLHGKNAIAYGIAWICAGVFVHCHYFWGNIYNQAWFAVLGKIVSACGFIAALGYVLVRNGVWGIR